MNVLLEFDTFSPNLKAFETIFVHPYTEYLSKWRELYNLVCLKHFIIGAINYSRLD